MAGVDPATFWGLTPRLYSIHMKAAQKRNAFARAAAAEAAWMGARADHKGLMEYVDALTGIDRRLPQSALASVMHAASSGVPVMSRAEYLKLRGSRNG